MTEVTDLHAAAFEMVRRWWQAWIDEDLSAVEQMVDLDYSERNYIGQREMLGPKGVLARASSDEHPCRITDWELSDPVTKLFEHVVVCSYVFRFSGSRGTHSFVYHGRATDVLSLKDGEWRFISHEGTLEGSRVAN